MKLSTRIAQSAIASAEARGHAAVTPVHVLLAIIDALGPDAPAGVARDDVVGRLPADGTARGAPTIGPDVSAILAEIGSAASAAGVADRIARREGIARSGAGGARAAAEPAGSRRGRSKSKAAAQPSGDDAAEIARETLAAVLAELDGLVGLTGLKQEIRRLVAIENANRVRRDQGLIQVRASNHLVFTGGAGTGKTTVAHIIARLFAASGIVSRGHLVEATRTDLVAPYVGQTAGKVEAVVRKALGGVLFIDEAYTLALDAGRDSGFGSEAIATLVQLMETHRNDLIVIVAGYPDEMRGLIESNAGLRSRFTRYLHFPDYAPEELLRIFDALAANHHVTPGPGVSERALEAFEAAAATPDFGNARFVRTYFEDAFGNMATRALEDGVITSGELETLTVADLPQPGVIFSRPRPRIGFAPR